ncbi:MAG: hypothetical protein NDJ92_21065 [Thermoanaerobaculia bacterium]|nr:hypothetical protein [Thermoanaerobaculia bacterium]
MSEPTISGPLSSALQRGRERYNALVRERVASGQRFDAAVLAGHLREVVGPVVDSVYRVDPGSVDPVTDVLFRLSLDLVSRDLVGPGTRYPGIAEGWKRILPAATPLLVRAPQHLAGSLANAAYNVSVATGAVPSHWIDEMASLARHCSEVTEFLDVGKITAWRAGLAHYRHGALEACRSLSPDLAALALGVEGGVASYGAMIERLEADPWIAPAVAARQSIDPPALRVVAVTGTFRGFGGPFRIPPKIYLRDGQLVAKDDEAAWTLAADRFGATWHRSSPDGLLAQSFPDATLNQGGDARIGTLRAAFPALGRSASQAFDGTTLAVTLPLSHRVWMLACTPP